jgi:4-amino-4-deoxy-L-arabinose transferase-like glycosyltransferase
MIPETSFSKIIWSNMEAMFKTLVMGVLIFGISGVLVRAHIFLVIACIATYTLFSFLLLGTNYVFMRFTGANISMGLLIVLYYPALAIVMAPGLVPALIVGFSIEGTFGTLLALLVLSVWELIAGLICFALSKSVLHNCDMQSLKPSK